MDSLRVWDMFFSDYVMSVQSSQLAFINFTV